MNENTMFAVIVISFCMMMAVLADTCQGKMTWRECKEMCGAVESFDRTQCRCASAVDGGVR